MSTRTSILVIENDATDHLGRLGPWLANAGVSLEVVRPYEGEAVPASGLSGYGGLIVLGGFPTAYPGSDGTPSAPWLPAVEQLLRVARRENVPTLGICLGAQLVAQALGGVVEPSTAGLQAGPGLVAKRDVAEKDPLFGPVPFLPDVLQWHTDEVTELPPGSILLAASPRCANEAFRVGERMWALQFHLEPDLEMIARWGAADADSLASHGVDLGELLARTEAVLDDLEEVWRPFAERFAAVVKGTVGGMLLPVLED